MLISKIRSEGLPNYLGYLDTASWLNHFPGLFNAPNLIYSLCVPLHLNALFFALISDNTQRPVRLSQVKALDKQTYARNNNA